MMQILPIKLVSQEEQEIFGVEAFNLAKLVRMGLPIAQGYVVTPPKLMLKTVLEHFNYKQREVFEQSLTLIKKEVNQLVAPEEFLKVFAKQKRFYVAGEKIAGFKKCWQHLLHIWLSEIRRQIWNEGFSPDLIRVLTPQLVFLVDSFEQVATSFFDPDNKDVVIESVERLKPQSLKSIDELTALANKKLFLPQVYKFTVHKGKIELVGIKPFTQLLPGSVVPQVVMPKTEQKKVIKSAIKVFLNLSNGFAIEKDIDGVLIEADYQFEADSLIFKLVEAAMTFPHQEVIFKLPDDETAEIRGCLRLAHQPKVLDQIAKIVLFLRHKKNLYNIKIAIPHLRSVSEYLQVKRELAVRGILRKGVFGFWLELGVPENFINLDEYLVAGFDGAIINLDSVWSLLGGVKKEALAFYKTEVNVLSKFLKEPLKKLHQNKIPVLVTGQLSLHPDILDFLVEAGVWGVVVNNRVEAQSLPQHLNWTAKRLLFKNLTD